MLGFDDAAVARTGKINGPGVAARQRLFETLHGLRPATPKEWLETLRFVWDRAIGLPVKMTGDVVQRPPLVFTSLHGHVPWSPLAPENRKMDARSAALNAANDEEIRMRALEKAKPPEVIEAADESETTLEVVKPLPAEDPSAYR